MSRAAAFIALLACACAEPTQLLVVCDTDYAPGTEVTAIEIAVSTEGALADRHRFELAESGVPFSLGVAPARRNDEAVAVDARALGPDGRVVVRLEARTSFVPNETRVLEMPLARACAIEPPCEDDGAELTCRDGACVSPAIDASALERWDGELTRLFDGVSDAGVPESDAGLPCEDGTPCDTGNACEVATMSCAGTPSCEVQSVLTPGSECGNGRTCDSEGRCGL
jgi:hypothetical protein